MAAVIELDGVGILRGQSWLLHDITWTVDESERWIIVGPNGAGKTTLMGIIAAQTHPTRGTATLLGAQMGMVDVFELRPRIGVAAATIARRIPPAEVVEDVVMSASYSVLGRGHETYDALDHARARDLMARMRVDGLADRTFGTLSEGEGKRVQIARALMTDPELLLLDEPGAGLDLAGRESLVDTLSELCLDEYAPATVLITHHVEEIPEGVTHALLLRDGGIVAAGPIDEVLTDRWMTETFGLPLSIRHEDGRWSARGVSPRHAAG